MLLSILRISHCVIWPRLVVIRELFVSANSNGSISSRHVHTGAQHLRGQTVFIVFQIKRSCGKCYCATRERRNLFLVQQQLNKNKQIESSFEFWDQYFGYKIQISRFAMHHRTTCMWKWLLEVINPQGMIFWLGSPPQLEAFKSPPVSFSAHNFLLRSSHSSHNVIFGPQRAVTNLEKEAGLEKSLVSQSSTGFKLWPLESKPQLFRPISVWTTEELLRHELCLWFKWLLKNNSGGCERGLA